MRARRDAVHPALPPCAAQLSLAFPKLRYSVSRAARLVARRDTRGHDLALCTAFPISINVNRLTWYIATPREDGLPCHRPTGCCGNNECYAESFQRAAPAAAVGRARRGRVHGRPAERLRHPGPGRRRGTRDQERRRGGDRRRDPLADHQPATARHPRDHPDPPHRLRHAHLHRRRVQGEHPGGDRHQAAWAAEAFTDLDDDVRQSIARIEASPFVPHTDAVRGFVFDVATGLLREVSH